MKNRVLLVVILFFVLGSAAISGTDSISHTVKSIFHGIGLFTLGMIGIISLYNFFKKESKKESM